MKKNTQHADVRKLVVKEAMSQARVLAYTQVIESRLLTMLDQEQKADYEHHLKRHAAIELGYEAMKARKISFDLVPNRIDFRDGRTVHHLMARCLVFTEQELREWLETSLHVYDCAKEKHKPKGGLECLREIISPLFDILKRPGGR